MRPPPYSVVGDAATPATPPEGYKETDVFYRGRALQRSVTRPLVNFRRQSKTLPADSGNVTSLKNLLRLYGEPVGYVFDTEGRNFKVTPEKSKIPLDEYVILQERRGLFGQELNFFRSSHRMYVGKWIWDDRSSTREFSISYEGHPIAVSGKSAFGFSSYIGRSFTVPGTELAFEWTTISGFQRTVSLKCVDRREGSLVALYFMMTRNDERHVSHLYGSPKALAAGLHDYLVMTSFGVHQELLKQYPAQFMRQCLQFIPSEALDARNLAALESPRAENLDIMLKVRRPWGHSFIIGDTDSCKYVARITRHKNYHKFLLHTGYKEKNMALYRMTFGFPEHRLSSIVCADGRSTMLSPMKQDGLHSFDFEGISGVWIKRRCLWCMDLKKRTPIAVWDFERGFVKFSHDYMDVSDIIILTGCCLSEFVFSSTD